MLKRFPNFSEIVSVYAVIASMLFAWAILLFIWYLPSWLYFMGYDDLLGVFCYVIASSFVESLAFLSFLLLLSFLLPQKYFKGEFVAYGASIALCVIGLIMIRLGLYNAYSISIPKFKEVLVFAPIVVSLLSIKIRPLRRALMWFSDRLVVFLYILIPLSMLSLLVIFIRNIF